MSNQRDVMNDAEFRRFAVLSDVHGNLSALNAVKADLATIPVDLTIFLGDAVGYGPDPEACVWELDKMCDIFIQGNHDEAVVTKDLTLFHPMPRDILQWTLTQLSKEAIDCLANKPTSVAVPAGNTGRSIMCVHGSPLEPMKHYIYEDLPEWAYDAIFEYVNELAFVDVLLMGHTHKSFHKTLEGKSLANPGSVGQPRDGNPKASYFILEVADDGEIRIDFRRVKYDIDEVVKRIIEEQLPPRLIRRLCTGV